MKDSSIWATLLAALISGSALPWAFRHARRIATGESVAQGDLLEAEARKANAEADDTIETRLWREIKRLDEELRAVRAEVEAVKTDAADEKRGLEIENRRLKRLVHILASELHRIDPENPKLAGVATALNQSFVVDPNVPGDMIDKLGEIGRKRRRRK